MSPKRPNFLVIIADDLGYSDIGCYGSEIKTPHIDSIAKEGCLFTDFHAAAACSPTRSMLLSGTDNHLAGVGVMSEMRGDHLERWNVRGHEGYLNYDVAPLPQLLQEGGYHTILSGKWHLGLRPETNPAARGFDRSLALLPGTSNHFGFEPQFDWHQEEVKHTVPDFFGRIPVLYTEDGKRKVFDANVENEYDTGFFSTEYYTDNLVKWFKERSDADREKPFYAMLPFSAPHWPLQCSKADREKYKGMYDDGPAALRARRVARLKELGIVGKDVVPHPVYMEDTCRVPWGEWDEFTEEQRAKSARSMECFAGMVDNIDQNVGKVLKYLEETGEKDNTVILFMSDNGAEGAHYESYPTMGKDLIGVLKKYYNNKLENIGNHDSFVWYGPQWAQASTAPSRLYKMYSTEGGIRVPFVVRYPPSWPKDLKVHSFATVMDIAPTFLDMASISHPVPPGQKSASWHGNEVWPMRGHSWTSFMKEGEAKAKDMSSIYGEDEFMGWELFGRAALRKGKWKIVCMPASAFGKGKWELFNLAIDPGEIEDLAEKEPEKLKELLENWEQYVKQTGAVWGDAVDGELDWASVPEDSVGGDPVAETRAWMTIGEGEVAAIQRKHT